MKRLSNRRSRMRQSRRPLRCESLENRIVLATFTVNDLGDTSDANPGDGVAEDAAGNTTLRAAIEEANALAGGDDIDFSVAGTVNLSLGELVITSELHMDGGGAIAVDANAASRVLNVSDPCPIWLYDLTLTNGSAALGGGIYNNAGDLMLSGVTVTGNSATNAGGIASFGGSLTLDNSTVSDNEAYQYGGGVFALQGQVSIVNESVISGNSVTNTGPGFSSGAGVAVGNQAYITTPLAGVAPFDLTIDNSTIEGNVLYGSNFPYGAGIYSFGYGTMDITNSTISGNSATGSGGARGGAGFNWPAGAFGPGATVINISDTLIDGNFSSEESAGFGFRATSIDNTVEMNITNSTISNNVAYGSGAAGFNWSAGDDPYSATLNISNSTISGNSAADTGGGFETNNTFFTVNDSTIDGNSAAAGGGGVYVSGSYLDDYGFVAPVATFNRTTISNNYSGSAGGGAYAYDSGFVLDNSTLSGNVAAGTGGGVQKRTYFSYVGTQYESFVDLQSSTVTNNYAGAAGGGTYGDYYSTMRFNGSIISGNTSGAGTPDVYAYLLPSSYYSLVGDNTGSPLVAANPDANGNIIGDSLGPISALLGPLAVDPMSVNGTATHEPMAGSPAIDAAGPAVGTTDQRGLGPRDVGGAMDMGSVEVGAGATAPDGDFNDDGFWDCTDINLLTAVTAAGTNDPAFDLTQDTLVNGDDIAAWLAEAGAINLISMNPYAPGDANLDGVVDGLDFIQWNNAKFSNNTAWCGNDNGGFGGNFNGDTVTDGLDFIIWNDNKFTQQGPITDSSGTPDRLDAVQSDTGRLAGRRTYRAKVGRGIQTSDEVLQVPFTPPGVETAPEIGQARVSAAVAFNDRVSSTENLSAYELETLDDSVSHHQDDVADRTVDEVFAQI